MKRYKMMKTDGNQDLIRNGFRVDSLDNIIVPVENGEDMSLASYLVVVSALAGQAAGTQYEERVAVLEEILDIIPDASNLKLATPNVLTLEADRYFTKPSPVNWYARIIVRFNQNAGLFWNNEEIPFSAGLQGEKKDIELFGFGEDISVRITEIQ